MNALTTFRNLLLDLFFHDFLTVWAAFRAQDLYTDTSPTPTSQDIETLAYQEAERYYRRGWIAFLLRLTTIGTHRYIVQTYAHAFLSSYTLLNQYTEQERQKRPPWL